MIDRIKRLKAISDKTIGYYDKNSELFKTNSINADMSPICNDFLSYLKPKSTILDLGCGVGRDTLYFKNKGYSVTPIDGSIEMCKATEKTSGIRARCLKFSDLDYINTFSGVWACASLLHVKKDDLPDILRKINKALKDNGILYMSFKYGTTEHFKEERLFTDLNENDIPLLCNDKTGFTLIKHSISSDVRKGRKQEKWLNIFAKK